MPVTAGWRRRWPWWRRAGTERKGSTARTPGRRSSSWSAPAERGLHEGDRDVLALGLVELQLGQQVHDVDEDEAEEEDPTANEMPTTVAAARSGCLAGCAG